MAAADRGSGEIVVDRSTLDIRGAKAQLGDVDWSGVQGAIARARQQRRGSRSTAPRAARSPTCCASSTSRRSAAGPARRSPARPRPASADLKLALVVPLTRPPTRPASRAAVALAGNDVRMIVRHAAARRGQGARSTSSQRGFIGQRRERPRARRRAGLRGRLERGPERRRQPALQRPRHGHAPRRCARPPSSAWWRASLRRSTGQASYRATLAFVGGRPQISVASNLVGVAVDLPAPLGKAAAAPLRLRVRTATEDGAAAAGEAAPQREHLAGRCSAARCRRSSCARGAGDAARVVRGAIRVAEPRPMPPSASPSRAGRADRGPAAAGRRRRRQRRVKKLDVEAWQSGARPRPGRGAARPALPRPPRRSSSTPAAARATFPTRSACASASSTVGSRRLANVTAGLSRQGELWRANVDADQLDGYIEYRPAAARRRAGAGRVYARLARLSLPKGEAERVESLLDAQPASLPALDIVVDDFELRGKHLGRLEIEATNRAVGSRDARARMAARQAQPDDAGGAVQRHRHLGRRRAHRRPRRRAARRWTSPWRSSTAAPCSSASAWASVVRGGKGSLAGERVLAGLAVLARLREDDRPDQGGDRLRPVPEGRARARRACSACSACSRCRAGCSLDFRDLFAEGFAFDSVIGDVTHRRRAWHRPTTCACAAPAAVVLMEGSADIERETAGPARRRRPRDQRRHRVARLR